MDWPIVQVSVNIGTSRPVTIQLVDVCISQMWHSVIISTVPHSLLLTTENQLSHFLVPIISQTCMYVVIQWTNQFNLKFVQQTHSLFFSFFFFFYFLSMGFLFSGGLRISGTCQWIDLPRLRWSSISCFSMLSLSSRSRRISIFSSAIDI